MLLINSCNRDYGGATSRFTPLHLPLPLGYLAAAMLGRGHKVKIVDEEVLKLNGPLLDELVSNLPKPLVFGFSVLTSQAARSYELAALVKARYPECTVVVGGFHVSVLPEEALGTGAVDFVVRGEGEQTLPALYEALARSEKDFSRIKGVSFRQDGRIVHTPDAPFIEDLDSLPDFPYHLFEELLRHPGVRRTYDWGFLLGSRGCPYKCIFCSQHVATGTSYRGLSAKRIVRELDILINRLGATNICFLDDNFCFKHARTREIADALAEAGFAKKCRLSLQTRADNFYPDAVPLLKKAGVTFVGFGMETGVERLLQLMRKGETVTQNIEAIRSAQSHGMDVSLSMIFGFPTETHADRAATVKMVNSLNPTHVKYNCLIPYPGTELYKTVRGSERLVKIGHWENFVSALGNLGTPINQWGPLPYVPESSSECGLVRDFVRYNLLVYLRPRAIGGLLRRTHGLGWFKLNKGWYFSLHNLYYLFRLAAVLLLNFVYSFLPDNLMRILIKSSVTQQRGLLPEVPSPLSATATSARTE